MIATRRIAGLTAALVSVTLVDACHKTPPAQPAPAVAPAAGPNADSASAAAAAARDAAAAAEALRTALTAIVHFDYDQADLRPGDRAILDAKVPILTANPTVVIQVAGHTDERGSDEYNLALGQRRASSVKAYLVQHGIADSRIQTISYGEERPMAQGTDESAYSLNRRAEFVITSGPQTLRKP